MNNELTVGDRVVLVAPDLLLNTGSFAYAGDKGTVVALQGFDRAVVSWGATPPYPTGNCRVTDLRRAEPKARKP